LAQYDVVGPKLPCRLINCFHFNTALNLMLSRKRHVLPEKRLHNSLTVPSQIELAASKSRMPLIASAGSWFTTAFLERSCIHTGPDESSALQLDRQLHTPPFSELTPVRVPAIKQLRYRRSKYTSFKKQSISLALDTCAGFVAEACPLTSTQRNDRHGNVAEPHRNKPLDQSLLYYYPP